MHTRPPVALIVALALLAPSAPAHAQAIARSFEALRTQVPPGPQVRLFDTNGHQTIGRIAEITAAEIALDVKNGDGSLTRVTWAEGDVRQISRQRSHWVGPLVGLGAGILIATQLCRRDGECGNKSRGGVSPMHVSGPLMMASIAGGPAIGRLLDRPGTERILYRAPEPVRSANPSAPRR